MPFEEKLFGEHDVAYVETRGNGTPAFIVFYPAAGMRGAQNGRRQYFRDEIISHGVTFEMNLKYLLCLGCRAEKPYPVRPLAEPLTKDGGQQWPLVFFSHGLFGSLEMYTNLCRHLASMGMVVVALGHEDGSACFCETEDGQKKYYIRPPKGIVYSDRSQVQRFRGPQLEQRTKELLSTLQYFKHCAAQQVGVDGDSRLPPPPPTSSSPSPKIGADVDGDIIEGILGSLMAKTDLNACHLSGHSFGAASTALTVHELYHSTAPTPVVSQVRVRSRICLDLWPWPLPDDVCQTKDCEVPSLFLESQCFMEGTECELTKTMARNTAAPTAFGYVIHSSHQQFSDAPLFFPKPIAAKLNMTGKIDRHEAYRAITTAIADFIAFVESGEEEYKPKCGPDSIVKWSYELANK